MTYLNYTGIRIDNSMTYEDQVSEFYTKSDCVLVKAYRVNIIDITIVIAPDYNIKLVVYTEDLSEQQISIIANNVMQDMINAQEINTIATYSLATAHAGQPLLQKTACEHSVFEGVEFVGESYAETTPKFIQTIPGLKEEVLWPVEVRNDRSDPDRKEKISEIIIDLNDTYEWPRERIADWLDTLDVDLTLGEL